MPESVLMSASSDGAKVLGRQNKKILGCQNSKILVCQNSKILVCQNSKILVCQNKTCKQQGGAQVLAAFKRCVPPEIEVEPSGCLGQCGNGPMAIVLTETVAPDGSSDKVGSGNTASNPIEATKSEPTKTWYSHLRPADTFAIAARHFKDDTASMDDTSTPSDTAGRSIGIWIVGVVLFLCLCALLALVVGGPSHYG